MSRSSILAVCGGIFLTSSVVLADEAGPDLKVDQNSQTKGWITIPRSEVQQMPAWTPYSGQKAPVSFGDAWRYVHADAEKLATASPLWTTYDELIYEPGGEQNNWFYRFHFNFGTIKDNTMCNETLTYIVLMDGSYVTNLEETRGVKIPSTWKLPNLHPVVPKPDPARLPEDITLLTATYTGSNEKTIVAYTIPRAQFVALPDWNFYSPDAPPVTLDQALDIVRQNAEKEWPGQTWKFANISLNNGRGPDTFNTCFYAITLLRDTPDPKKQLPLVSLQLVLMDGSLLDVDSRLINNLATGVSW